MTNEQHNDPLKVILGDEINVSEDRVKNLYLGATQVSYKSIPVSGTIQGGSIFFNSVGVPDLANSVISRNMRIRYRVVVTAGPNQLGMFNPNVVAQETTGLGSSSLPYAAFRPFPLSTVTNCLTVSINGSSTSVRLRDVMSGITRTIPRDYLEKEATQCPSQLDNGWILVSDNQLGLNSTVGSATNFITSSQPLSSCYNCPKATSRASFVPISYTVGTDTPYVPDRAEYEISEPIFCSPMTLDYNQTWLGNVNMLSVMYQYSNLGDMVVYGQSVAGTVSGLNPYPVGYSVSLVENSAKLCFAIASVDTRIVSIPKIINYPFSNPQLYSTRLKPFIPPMSMTPVQNTGNVSSQVIRLSYMPSLIYIYAQIPPDVRAQYSRQALLGESHYSYPDVFYSLGSSNNLEYDASQTNVLSVRLNNRDGLMAGSSIGDLYKMSVSNGYDSSFTDWLASPIIIINPVKDLGIDFSQDVYPDMLGITTLSVQCSFNTYNMVSRTLQTLYQPPTLPLLHTTASANFEYYAFVDDVAAYLYQLEQGVDTTPQLKTAFQTSTPCQYLFYAPIENIFWAVSGSSGVFVYSSTGVLIAQYPQTNFIAGFWAGSLTQSSQLFIAFPIQSSQFVQVLTLVGTTITSLQDIASDQYGNLLTNVTAIGRDATSLTIAQGLKVTVYTGTTYYNPIRNVIIPTPPALLQAPKRALLGEVPASYNEYYTYVRMNGTIGAGRTGELSTAENGGPPTFISGISLVDSLGEPKECLGFFYDPLNSKFWAVAPSYVYVYNLNGSFFTELPIYGTVITFATFLPSKVAGVNGLLTIGGGSLVGVETLVGNTIVDYVITAIERDVAGNPFVNLTSASINDSGLLVIASAQQTSTYAVTAGGTVVTGVRDTILADLSPTASITSLSIDEPNDRLFCSIADGDYRISSYVLSTGVLILSGSATAQGPLNIVYDEQSEQLRTSLNTAIQTINITDPATLAFTTPYTFEPDTAASIGYSTFVAPPPPPVVDPAYGYYAFVNAETEACLYQIVAPNTTPQFVSSFTLTNSTGATVVCNYLQYDSFNAVYWACSETFIYVYSGTGAFIAQQAVSNVVSASFYESTALGISAQIVLCIIAGTQNYVSVWNLVGSTITQVGSIISDNFAGQAFTRITCASRDATNLVIADSYLGGASPCAITVYSISGTTFTALRDLSFAGAPTTEFFSSILIDTPNNRFFTVTDLWFPNIIANHSLLGTYYDLLGTQITGPSPINSLACFPDFVFASNAQGTGVSPTAPTVYSGNISTLTPSGVFNGYSSGAVPIAICDYTHNTLPIIQVVVGVIATNPSGAEIVCQGVGNVYNTVSNPIAGMPNRRVNISVDQAGYLWFSNDRYPSGVFKANELPVITDTPPYLNYVANGLTVTEQNFRLNNAPVLTGIDSITFDVRQGSTLMYCSYQGTIYTAQYSAFNNAYIMSQYIASSISYGGLYIPPLSAYQTGTPINNLGIYNLTTGANITTSSQLGNGGIHNTLSYDSVSDQVLTPINSIVGTLVCSVPSLTLVDTYNYNPRYCINLGYSMITEPPPPTNIYDVVSISPYTANNLFYCVLNETTSGGALVSSTKQSYNLTTGVQIATAVADTSPPSFTIFYDTLLDLLVCSGGVEIENRVKKLDPATLATDTTYNIAPPTVSYLGFSTEIKTEPPVPPAPSGTDWATLNEVDLQILTIQEGICQISPDFFRINTACISMAEAEDAIIDASEGIDASFVPQSVEGLGGNRGLFGSQRSVISGIARGAVDE